MEVFLSFRFMKILFSNEMLVHTTLPGRPGARNFPGWPGKTREPGSPEIFSIARNFSKKDNFS